MTAAAIIGLGSAGFASRADAQSANASPACASIKDATAGAKCEISESIRRTNANIQRGNEAEKRSECTQNLTSWARGNNSRIEAVRVILNGRSIKDVDTCDVWQRVQRTTSLDTKLQLR